MNESYEEEDFTACPSCRERAYRMFKQQRAGSFKLCPSCQRRADKAIRENLKRLNEDPDYTDRVMAFLEEMIDDLSD